METVKTAKQNAGALLGQNGARLRLIFCGILLIFGGMTPWIVGQHVATLVFGELTEPYGDEAVLWQYSALSLGVGVLLTLTVTALVVGALYAYGQSLYTRLRTGVAQRWELRRHTLGRLWRGGVLILVRPMGAALLFAGAYLLSERIGYTLHLPLLCLAALLAALLFYATGSWFLVPYYLSLGDGGAQAIGKSRQAMKQRKKLYGAYQKRFAGLVCLSVLTVGVLLVLYTVPLMLMTYFSLVQTMEDEEAKEEIIHE